MMGINPINYANSLATSQVAPIYTTPVQPVHRIEGYSTPSMPRVNQAATENKAFEETLNKYIDKYKGQSHVEFQSQTPYQRATKAFEGSIMVGMNLDLSV